MTDETGFFESDSRRSFVKKGALAAGGLTLAASGTGLAQQTTEQGTETTPTGGDVETEALVQTSSFHPGGRFTFVSGVVDWTPDMPDVSDDVWTSYNTYMIRWLNTNEIVPLWVRTDADIGSYSGRLGYVPAEDAEGERPRLFEMQRSPSAAQQGENLVEVTASQVSDDQAAEILGNDEWWQQDEEAGEGTATATPSTDTPS